MKTFKLIFLLGILFFASCRKDSPENEDYPVIEPGSYFPVYPGSWWKYAVNDTLIITDSTAGDYVIHNYIMTYSYNNNTPVYTDKCYVPYYYSSDHSPFGVTGPIYRYEKIVMIQELPPCFQSWPILKEVIGAGFSLDLVTNHTSVYEKVTVTAKYFNGQDSVLVLVGRPNLDFGNIHVREFYKDIGLARDFWIEPTTGDTVSRIILVDYHISK